MAIKHSRDEPDYHSADYWNSRYKGGAMSNFAWYCGLDALKPLLSPLLADASSVLEIGCGAGNTLLPLLHANPAVRGLACDLAPSAVALARDGNHPTRALLVQRPELQQMPRQQ